MDDRCRLRVEREDGELLVLDGVTLVQGFLAGDLQELGYGSGYTCWRRLDAWQSYDQVLWTGLKKKAAYLPGC